MKIETKLPAMGVFDSENKVLQYYIQSGASWTGSIGSEEVSIHFKYPLTEDKELTYVKDKIIKATPPGYVIKDKTIQWRFNDFKPKDHDHDIRVEYWNPD